MSLAHALWTHGHSAEIENANDIVSMEQRGYHVRVEGKPSTDNWLHFAVPTPVIVDDVRLRPDTVWFRYKTEGGASVNAVHVWDGDKRIAAVAAPTGAVEDGWTTVKVGFDSLEILAVHWGIGVSIGLSFGRHGGRVDVETVGCDFEYANQVCSQRLPLSTKKRKMLEFPYRSNRPIDVPSDAITRILIALHGTGGDGDLYLRNGLAAADHAGASDQTLIIAPQFIKASEYWRTHDDWGDFPADLLYWGGGRAYAAESVERDRDGDGVHESGTLGSYTILDKILERVSKPSLFPNLQIIVIAGQSNGGQFICRYAATSQFEDHVARRGIHVRYVSMSSGSYLYLDGERAVPGTTNSFAVPAGCAGYDDWPFGLANLDHCSYEYPKRVGARTIRDQFAGRNVIYLQGANDNTPETADECAAALQGRHAVEKGEIYFNYLQHYYGARLRHARHVVAGVGHSGLDLMTSSTGQSVIFGPP